MSAEASALAPPVLLPTAPDDRERLLYVKRHPLLLGLPTVLAFCGITYGFLRVSLISGWLDIFLAYWSFMILSFAVSLGVNYVARDFDVRAHDLQRERWLPLRYPSVDIWLPNCGEPLDVLRNTWLHVRELFYPGTLTFYCLDDVGDPSVEFMAAEFGFEYLSRPNKGWMKKSGNLRHAYEHSSGELIVVFDADFCPRSDFLWELVPYFTQGDVAIVQSAQYFRVDSRQNWIERGAAQVQEFFYRMCQLSRAVKGAAICCGTNAVYRRAALADIGGMVLIPQGEDMRTGFELQCHGWRVRYVPLNLAMGLSPSDMSSYFKQQYRWCTGSLRLVSDRTFWEAPISPTAKLCYMAGFNYYLQAALYNFMLPSLIIALLIFFPQHFHVNNYIIILPAILVMMGIYPLWHRARFGPSAWSIRVVCQWTYVFAIVDFIREATIPWDATGSSQRSVSSTRRFSQFRVTVCLWNGLVTAAWFCLALWRSSTLDWVSFLFVSAMGFFWLAVTYRVILTLRKASY